MGDFNFSNICSKSNFSKNQRTKKFLFSLVDNLMYQKVEERIKEYAILDLILTSRKELLNKMKVTGTLGESHDVML